MGRVNDGPQILVTSLAGLASDAAAFAPTHAVSLLNPSYPEEPPPIPSVLPQRRLVQRYWDSGQDRPGAPQPEHARELVGWLRRVLASPDRGSIRLLLHCHHGTSRSAAAAYLALCLAYGPGREEEALREVRRVRVTAFPSLRLVTLAAPELENGDQALRVLLRFRSRFRAGRRDARA
jgi:predicted protein tyrosine phosphatase